jgi:hypothetical protein
MDYDVWRNQFLYWAVVVGVIINPLKFLRSVVSSM